MAARIGAEEDDGLVADINVTPFVDVMLVLLIVFMITAPMLAAGIPVSLPRTVIQDDAGEADLILTIERDRTVYIGTEPVHVELLPERLQALAASRRELQFRADEDVPYGFVARILDLVKTSGFPEVHLITEPAPAKEGRRRR